MTLYRYTDRKVEDLIEVAGEDALRAARLVVVPGSEGEARPRYRYVDCPEDDVGYPYGPRDVEPVEEMA